MKQKIFIFVCLCTLALGLTNCCKQQSQPKYVFYFIGDGMGPNQVLATEMYLAELQGRIGREPLCFTQFPYSGALGNYSSSNGITDSSAAGTALACGVKTQNHFVGVDSAGNSIPSIAAILKENGWPVAVTTSVSIDHATPSAFYAHSEDRNDYYKIGAQLATSNYDFFAGSTFYSPNCKDDSTATNLYDLCQENGYTFAHGLAEFNQLKDSAEKLILIQDFEGLEKDYKGTGMIPFQIDWKSGELRLKEIVAAGIDFLSKKGDRFFMMCEGGAIDWAAHSNDGASVIGEVLELDSAIRVAYDFYLAHPDETLIIVTADHETGGMGLGNSDYTLNLQILQNQKGSIGTLHYKTRDLHKEKGKKLTFDDVKNMLREQLGFYDNVEITEEEEALLKTAYKNMMRNHGTTVKTLYQDIDEVANVAMKILNKKAKLGWTSHGHTGAAVPVFAIGVGAEKFTGWQDNTDIKKHLVNLTNQTEN